MMLLPLMVSAALAGGPGQTGKWEVQFSPQTSTCGTAPAIPPARWQVKVDGETATVTGGAGSFVGWSKGSEISVTREVEDVGHQVFFGGNARSSDWIGLVFTGDTAVGSLRQLRLAPGTQVMCFSDWKVSARRVGLELTALPADKRLDGVGCAYTLPNGPQVMAESGNVWWVGLDGQAIDFVEAGDAYTAPDGDNQWWLKLTPGVSDAAREAYATREGFATSPSLAAQMYVINPSVAAGMEAAWRDGGATLFTAQLWSARSPEAKSSFILLQTCGD